MPEGQWRSKEFTSGRARDYFSIFGWHKLKNLKICLSICTYLRSFRNFWVGLCPLGPYSGFATADGYFNFNFVFSLYSQILNDKSIYIYSLSNIVWLILCCFKDSHFLSSFVIKFIKFQ
jgi:hypothetical protein